MRQGIERAFLVKTRIQGRGGRGGDEAKLIILALQSHIELQLDYPKRLNSRHFSAYSLPSYQHVELCDKLSSTLFLGVKDCFLFPQRILCDDSDAHLARQQGINEFWAHSVEPEETN